MGPYENCCLGSINLSNMYDPSAKNGTGGVDWFKLRDTTCLATDFLDDVISANKYIPSVPQLKAAAMKSRRIGLGVMGFADLCIKCGIKYGSKEGIDFAGQIMEYIRYHSMLRSIQLSAELGPFEAIKGSIYDPSNITWKPPKPIETYDYSFGRPSITWAKVLSGIKNNGIRNAAITTVAPTGTIATVAGCEGYGCEPVFAFAYRRNMLDGDKNIVLKYGSPLFENALNSDKTLSKAQKQEIINRVVDEGTCQGIVGLPSSIKSIFVNANDLSPEEHIRMQAAFQAFVDNSLSKTVNCPNNTTVEDVESIYKLAWELGCKGVTIYREGSRNKVVLETNKTVKSKQTPTNNKTQSSSSSSSSSSSLVSVKSIAKRKKKKLNVKRNKIDQYGRLARPDITNGCTIKTESGYGKVYTTINEVSGNPFEVFITGAKPGSDTDAVCQAMARLISYILRLDVHIPANTRVNGIIKQLRDIKGSQTYGFGDKKTHSLPDVVSKALKRYVLRKEKKMNSTLLSDSIRFDSDEECVDGSYSDESLSDSFDEDYSIGSICPECKDSTLYKSENCIKCKRYDCSYSLCG